MFQFMHVEGYARSSAKKVKIDRKTGKATSVPKRSVAEIIAEVLRDAGHCPHVENPLPPTFHYGDEAAMRGIPDRIEANCAEWKRQGNKTVRKDTQVLHTVIVSYERGVGTDDDYREWERRNIQEAKRKFGDRLVAVLGHPDDEEHPHLHIYVLPLFGENPNVKTLHAGHAAVAHANAQIAEVGIKLDPKTQGHVYKAAMRSLQDEYYENVGMYCGMTRVGAGGRRLARADKKKENDQARAVSDALAALAAGRLELENGRAELAQRQNNLDSLIEERAALRAVELKRADSIKLIAKETPALLDEPALWQVQKMGDFIKSLRNVIAVQAAKLAMLPMMKETMALMRSEGAKVIKEKDDLMDRVKVLAEHAQAWKVVQQIYPDVATEVERRIAKAGQGGTSNGAPGGSAPGQTIDLTVAMPALEPVYSN